MESNYEMPKPRPGAESIIAAYDQEHGISDQTKARLQPPDQYTDEYLASLLRRGRGLEDQDVQSPDNMSAQ